MYCGSQHYTSCAAFVGRRHKRRYCRWSSRWCCRAWTIATRRSPVYLATSSTDYIQSVMIDAAARLVCSARKYEHITPLLRDLHWLRVSERIEFKLSVLVFRCLHGTVPGERATSCGGHGYKKEVAIFVDVCPCHTIFVSYDDW